MASKATDRIKALQQQRAAALAPQTTAPTGAPASASADMDMVAVRAHFGDVLDQVVRNRQIQHTPIGHIAPDARPEMRQPRLLPHPRELLVQGQPVPAYRELVAELQTLGQSLKEQQIQPIVVYPGTNDDYPAARYLILVGQRRWTAANLVGLDALDAIVVDPPSPADRVRIQYAENEDREEFSDMERAWSLQQMKQALSDAPWEEVETRLQLSRTRRHQLIRLLTFTPEQQQQIARLRLQETQIRPLHTALRNQELDLPQVDSVLQRLSEIADTRGAGQATAEGEAGDSAMPKRSGIDGPTIARVVAHARRAVVPAPPTPRWLPIMHEQIARTHQSFQRSIGRVEQLNDDDAQQLLAAATELRNDIDRMVTALQEHERRSKGE
jgi:ParB/RepB/Spo0J family partition protein